MMKLQYKLPPNFQPNFSNFYKLSQRSQEKIRIYYEQSTGTNDYFSKVGYDFNTQSCEQSCQQIIDSSAAEEIIQYNNNQLARWYYQLGISDYADGNVGSSINFIEYARHLAPEWSFWHLELATIYLNEGNIQKTSEILDQCKSFSKFNNYCWNMLDDYRQKGYSFTVGAMSEKINKTIPYPGEISQ
jgi:tetratricopeptide (TPR) repeat protein